VFDTTLSDAQHLQRRLLLLARSDHGTAILAGARQNRVISAITRFVNHSA
jgi:hypothetical protein